MQDNKLIRWAILSLVVVLAVACPSCVTPADPGEAPTTVQKAMRVLRAVGDVAIRTDGTAALLKYAPEAMPLVDADSNGVVTLAELEALVADAQDPESLTFLLLMARELVGKGR